MKNTYVKPEMQVEEFLASNYCASACGEEKKVYKFVCDASGGKDYNWTVYEDADKNGQLDLLKDNLLTIRGYHPCGATHEAPVTDDFVDGWLYRITGLTSIKIPVKIWRGPGNDNVHCTENINMSSWTITKS